MGVCRGLSGRGGRNPGSRLACYCSTAVYLMLLRFLTACLSLALLSHSHRILAHNPVTSSGGDRVSGLLSLALLVGFWFIYMAGTWRRPAKGYLALCFHFTVFLCALTLLGPLDDWAKTSTAAHMVQHMLLMVVIAPLWVMSRPLAQIIAGGGAIMAWLWRLMLRATRYPMMTAYAHGAVIWFWHLPYFYMLAVDNTWWHALEHLCFLFTAGLFWWAVLQGSRHNTPWALLALLFTLMHTGFLGAFLTFARAPLYGEARSLADQQLAGLIMWVVGAIPYLCASAWMAHEWYKQLQRRMDKQGD